MATSADFHRMRRVVELIVLIICILEPLGSKAEEESAVYGPLYSRFPLTLATGTRTEALGPVFNSEHAGTESSWGISPLFSVHNDATTDYSEYDVLYPLLTYDRFGLDYRWQFIQLFSFSGGATMESTGKRRFTLFPFYFQQRSPDPALNYTAVMPFYGHIKNRFFRDEIFFVMVPFYIQSRKRDVVTDNYLVPVFDHRHGDGLWGWQFWPFIGREHKDITTHTNDYGESEIVPGHEKLFVLWPFFFKNDLGIGSTNQQTQRLLLPFYSTQRSPLRDSTSYLWPFGYTHTEDRERKYTEWACPWPLIDFARGEGKTLNRVWPIFSQGKTPTVESDFYLWPIYKYNRVTAEPLDRQRTRILFFLYSDLTERDTLAGTTLRQTDFWPLFHARRDPNGNETLQVFALLEGWLPSSPGIERVYSPLWSIWRSQKNGKTGAKSQAFLWNLYRQETTTQSRKYSLLFGLFQYESGPEGRRWRVFYLPFRGAGRPASKA
jgi:hypothetical protein